MPAPLRDQRRSGANSLHFGAIPGYARAGTMTVMRVLGVDAYRKGRKGKGWIGVELHRGTFVARILRTA
jgi:hypothetical protein